MDWVSLSISVAVACLTTFFCIQLLRPVALRVGLMDVPGGRKTHADSVPLIGGLSVFIGFCFGLLCLNISLAEYRGLLAGAALLILIGVVDDFRELSPKTRLFGQVLASLLLMEWGHVFLHHLGNLFFHGDVGLGIFSMLFTVFFVVGFVNAINMIDGLDGLAGSVVLGQAAFLYWLNFHFGQLHDASLLLIFMAAMCVFLLFNMRLPWRKKASVFMGDAGSTFIGFLIAWFTISLSQWIVLHRSAHIGFNFMTTLWIIAYPLYDLLAVVVHRLSVGKSPFSAGRDHLHYVLLGLGLTRTVVAWVLFLFSVLLGLLGVILAHEMVSEPWQVLIFVAIFVVYCVVCFCATRLPSSSDGLV